MFKSMQNMSSSSTATFFIPGHVPSSKNSRVLTQQGLFIASKAVQKYRKNSKEDWRSLAKEFRQRVKDKEAPIKIGFHFVRKTRHKYDWVNPLQTVLDEMVKHHWVSDDNIEVIIPVPFTRSGSYTTYDPKTAGVHIRVYS